VEIVKKTLKIILAALFTIFVFFNINGDSNAYAQEAKFTPIMGESQATKEQAIQILKTNNHINNANPKTDTYISDFVNTTWNEAASEGVRADVAFSLMMLETGWLKFGGDVKEHQNNFGGLGATGGGNPGHSFPDTRTGIRAVVQHLKAYASSDPLQSECVDPRFQYVTKGSAEYIEWLGIKENPEGYGWAAGYGYGYKIINIMNQISGKPLIPVIHNLTVTPSGSTYSITATASYASGALYKFIAINTETEQTTLIQNYNQNNKVVWIPSSTGSYKIIAYIKNPESSEYDAYTTYNVIVETTTTIKSFNIDAYSFFTGQTYTATAIATSANEPLYRFWIGKKLNDGTWTWNIIQDYSEKNIVSWKVSTPGTYRVNVHVRDSSSSEPYDDFLFNTISVNQTPIPTKILSLDSGGTTFFTENTYTATATATSTNKPHYRFWIGKKLNDGTWTWNIIQDYSEKNTVSWKVSTPGTYRVNVHVRDSSSSEPYDDFLFNTISVNQTPIPTKILSLDSGGTTFFTENTYTATATATSTNKPHYRFWIGKKLNDGTWTWNIIQDYSEKNTVSWKVSTPGTYRVNVHVRDSSSSEPYDDFLFNTILVNQTPIPTKILSLDSGGTTFFTENTYTATATATSTNKPHYRFWIGKKLNDGTWTWNIIQDYSEKNTVSWKVSTPGTYRVNVHVRDSSSSEPYDDFLFNTISVNQTPIPTKILSLDSCGTTFFTENTYTATATATSTNKPHYRFWIGKKLNDGTWTWNIIQDYSEKNTVSWNVSTPGTYRVNVHVRDSSSSEPYDDFLFNTILVVSEELFGGTIVLDAGHGGIDPGAISS
jgi:N-acetylmuramoyl-L-alanine amidase